MSKPTVIITGAARRIGKALSISLHQQGYDLAIHCFDSINEAKQLAESLNEQRQHSCQVFQANLCNESELIQLSQDVLSWRQQVSVLINNASMFNNDHLTSDSQHWQTLFDCNVKAPYELSHLFLSSLQSQNGCIINITDVHVESPLDNYAIYSMTKAALHNQTLSLAKKFAPLVRVNAIAPGVMLWPEDNEDFDKHSQLQRIANIPLACSGGTEPIVQAAHHFINNSYVTGTSIAVDGGWHL